MEHSTSDKDFLTTFAKGLNVIRSFEPNSMNMTLTEVAKKNDLSRASARRFLLTMLKLGYVETDGNRFSLTAKVLELGYSYLSTLDVGGTVSTQLELVTQQLGESSSAAVLEGENIVYIARIPVRPLMAFNLQIGARLPAYATSMGRVLLSGLPEEELDHLLTQSNLIQLTPNTLTSPSELKAEIAKVRVQGYAINDQELELGLRSVAVPVFNRNGKLRLTLNVSCHSSKTTVDRMISEFVPVLKDTAQRISMSLP
ncbi:IclR family transcriptional regulator C-terminal domain-containing protein [Vibrio natriegens]|uniref:IclR family transcriptional regulator domain-containing protein n=1 Tax=Vibrio natriegens TaxID=691 RepID=UPI002E308434|nr:IclR family transcriptional regulator C-terminal domain-containing protein [Vibrio natriegens]